MRNPWLDIPLADYERHMALPDVAQAQLLADVFERLLEDQCPSSVAVIGCAGGNGFDRISTSATTRVVGVDINPAYVEELRARFQDRLINLELIAGDIQSDDVLFRPVELVYAALLLEYVDVPRVLTRLRSLLTPGGMLATVVQLPSPTSSPVTPSPCASVQALASCMRLVPPEQLTEFAARAGYALIASWPAQSLAGKHFQVQAFRALNAVRT